MSRPRQHRHIECNPPCRFFKPNGIPLKALQQIDLSLEELEAIRLSDLEGLYQTDAAAKMGISRQTLGRILCRAHHKIAQALVEGKTLAIQMAD